MTPYEATLATADLFERRPELYKFGSIWVPECGSPGCAIGHIEAFSGRMSGAVIEGELLGVSRMNFYERMTRLEPEWLYDAALCAKGMCLYAEKYLRHEGIPASVREIFEGVEA